MVKQYRRGLSLLLISLLVFCQQVGFAHAIGHLGSSLGGAGSPRPVRSDTQHPAEKSCTQCVLFAQLGTAATGSTPQLATLVNDADAPLELHREFIPVFTSVFRSRAPPLPIA